MSATHEVYNKTNNGVVSQHDNGNDAQTEAQRLNEYHNNNVFAPRAIKDGASVSEVPADRSPNPQKGNSASQPVKPTPPTADTAKEDVK